jgi:3-oxoacyl-[acyl-carrier-protein] synthase-3
VQALIGATNAAALDIQAACSGFVYGLALADGMIQSRQARRVLVIGAETYSRIVDWQDRGTCILFGDGAGAILLEASDTKDKTGILASKIYADGKKADILKTTGGVSLNQQAGVVTMQGREVFRHAVASMSEATLKTADQAGIALEEIDWLIPHQANLRIVDSIAEKLNFPREKVIATMDKHANTSAASIPLAWSCALQDNRIKPGEILALPALGAGLTWGCCIIKS